MAPNLVLESACFVPTQPVPLDPGLPWDRAWEEAECILDPDMPARATARVGRARACRPPLLMTTHPTKVTDHVSGHQTDARLRWPSARAMMRREWARVRERAAFQLVFLTVIDDEHEERRSEKQPCLFYEVIIFDKSNPDQTSSYTRRRLD